MRNTTSRNSSSSSWKRGGVFPFYDSINNMTDDTDDDDDFKPLLINDDNDNTLLSSTTSRTVQQQQSLSNNNLQSMRQRAKQQRQQRGRNNNPITNNNKLYPMMVSSQITEEERYKNNNNDNPAIKNNNFHCLCTFGCIQCIRTKEIGVRENCGEFQDMIGPGLYCMYWPFVRIANRLSLKIQQLDITVTECKTKDGVFLERMILALQYRIRDPYLAQYRTTDTTIQDYIKSLVKDAARSAISNMDIDELFTENDNTTSSSITDLVFDQISRPMLEYYGYEIIPPSPLVIELTINPLVRTSMNEINTCQRLKIAVSHKAEALKIGRMKRAEAEAEQSYLHGVGIANQRSAIATGMKDVIRTNNKSTSIFEEKEKESLSNKDVLDILLFTQYMDTLSAVTKGGDNGLMLYNDPSKVAELCQQLSFSTTKTREKEELAMKQEDRDMMLLEDTMYNSSKKF